MTIREIEDLVPECRLKKMRGLPIYICFSVKEEFVVLHHLGKEPFVAFDIFLEVHIRERFDNDVHVGLELEHSILSVRDWIEEWVGTLPEASLVSQPRGGRIL